MTMMTTHSQPIATMASNQYIMCSSGRLVDLRSCRRSVRRSICLSVRRFVRRLVRLSVGNLWKKWPLKYQMVTKPYQPFNLCDSIDSIGSCDSCDSSDSSYSIDRSASSYSSDSCECSEEKKFFTKKLFLTKKKLLPITTKL